MTKNYHYRPFTSKEFWRRHAPDFNFELNEKQLIEKGLERGFIKRWGDFYEYNPTWKPVTAEDVNKVIRDNGTDASEMVQDQVDDELYNNHRE